MSLAVDPAAPQWAKTMALAIDQALTRMMRPQAPTRTAVFADVAGLPAAAQWPNCVATCLDVGAGQKALVWSDGADWYPVTVGAAL